MMDLLDKHGHSKIVQRCSYPLTAAACVKRIYTDFATFECAPDGLILRDKVEGLELGELEDLLALRQRGVLHSLEP